MTERTLAERLGYAPQDRVVIWHADDIGMCHGANAAFVEQAPFGLITCGAVMVPCPWFAEIAAYCRAHPELDMGVHITLNAEWLTYRWGPISTRDPASGLLDAQGYLPRSVAELHRQMKPEAAIAEMRAQVERALAAGIDVTHIDTHMGAVLHLSLLSAYIQLGIEFRVPVMLPRLTRAAMIQQGASEEAAAAALAQLAALEGSGLPVLDAIASGPATRGDPEPAFKKALDALPSGVTHFLCHPNKPSAEIKAITPNWEYRQADYRAGLSEELRDHVAASGIRLIGYRRLRDLIRGQA